MCVSLQRRAIQNFKMYVSLQRRAQKCMKWAHGVGSRPRHTKIIVLPQFRTSDQHEVTKGLHRRAQKFAFHHSFGRPTSTKWRKGCARTERICISPQFRASDDHFLRSGLLRQSRKFVFHHSFGRPTITFCVKGCFGDVKICISPQFWASDDHFLRSGLLSDVKNLHFTTVLSVRRARKWILILFGFDGTHVRAFWVLNS